MVCSRVNSTPLLSLATNYGICCRVRYVYSAYAEYFMDGWPDDGLMTETSGHFIFLCCGPTRARASSFLRFLDHTQRRITVGSTPLDERSSSSQRPLPYNTHNRQTSMPPAGFEPTISAGERPQTYALDRAATGTGTSSQ